MAKKRRKPNLNNPNSLTWLKKADNAWSLYIREVGECEICSAKGERAKNGWHGIEAHHLIERTHFEYRHDPSNGICLCSSCHKWGKEFSVHEDKAAFWEWLKKERPGQWQWLQDHTFEVSTQMGGSEVVTRRPISKNDWDFASATYKEKCLMLESMIEPNPDE